MAVVDMARRVLRLMPVKMLLLRNPLVKARAEAMQMNNGRRLGETAIFMVSLNRSVFNESEK